jgi:hypothetical protein
VDSGARAESMFDPVMYEKGAALLRMLRAWGVRNSRELLPPAHEVLPGAATPETVRTC